MSERMLSSSGLPKPEPAPKLPPSSPAESVSWRLSTHWWKALLVVAGVLAAATATVVPPLESPTIRDARLTERVEQVQTEANAWLKSIPAPSYAGTDDLSRIFLEPAIHDARATPEQQSALNHIHTS